MYDEADTEAKAKGGADGIENEVENRCKDDDEDFIGAGAVKAPAARARVAGGDSCRVRCRFLWRKLRERSAAPGYEGVLQREESSDPLAVKSLSASGHLLTDELKTCESQFSVTPADEMEDMTSHSPLLTYGASTGTLHNHTSQSANGSIITMTLKNNHLIVETEERGVRLEAGGTKTTTTKFSASASPHQNGVFVVEVQQGGVAAGASAGGAGAAGSQPYAPSTALFAGGATAGAATGADAQRAQVREITQYLKI
ncbi:Uncharacterized protein GBIM_17950 [Gryllus bimaculatus]|nr:Uncharacterized protein GBIM_17950 [Gryllus bimaculatus]